MNRIIWLIVSIECVMLNACTILSCFIGLWDSEKEVELRDSARVEVLASFNAAEAQRKPPVSEMFTDVYDVVCPDIQRRLCTVMKYLLM